MIIIITTTVIINKKLGQFNFMGKVHCSAKNESVQSRDLNYRNLISVRKGIIQKGIGELLVSVLGTINHRVSWFSGWLDM